VIGTNHVLEGMLKRFRCRANKKLFVTATLGLLVLLNINVAYSLKLPNNIRLPSNPISPEFERECEALSAKYKAVEKELFRLARELNSKNSKFFRRNYWDCGNRSCRDKVVKASNKVHKKIKGLHKKAYKVADLRRKAFRQCRADVKNNRNRIAENEARQKKKKQAYSDNEARQRVIKDRESLSKKLANKNTKALVNKGKGIAVSTVIKKDKGVDYYFRNVRKAQKTLDTIKLFNKIYKGESVDTYNEIVAPTVDKLISSGGHNPLVKAIMKTAFGNLNEVNNYTLNNIDLLAEMIRTFDVEVGKSRKDYTAKLAKINTPSVNSNSGELASVNNNKCETEYTDYAGDSGAYSGQCKNGVPHGQGEIKYYNGGRYSGSFRVGVRSGQGTFTADDGLKYQGGWRDDKSNGHGTLTWSEPDSAKYQGEFRDGKRNGQGTMAWADGSRYQGEWRDSERNGQGTIAWADGSRYQGEFRDDKPNGQGTTIRPSGYRHQGEYGDGKWNGQGTMTWPNGSRYQGEFRDDKRNGQGTYNWDNGDRYQGEYINDRRTNGWFQFSNGVGCKLISGRGDCVNFN
jgi:hypothetical protein